MVKLNGAFQFVAGESESDCAIFFIGDVDEIVSLTITELNMRDSCNQQDEYVKVSFQPRELDRDTVRSPWNLPQES